MAVAGVVLLLCATSVGALLADLYGFMSMAEFARLVTLPGLVLLTVLAVAPIDGLEDLRRRIVLGAVAGVVGVVAYDVFRIPFAMAGQRIFAPIFSYGLLIDGGGMSSPWTDLLGWLFHLSNGVTFGIAYAVVMKRRHWAFGVVWGLTLEAVAFLGPFTVIYGLTGKTAAIVIAFLAHIAYGLPLGLMVQHFDETERYLRTRLIRPGLVVIGAAVVVLVLWHRPWSISDELRDARELSTNAGMPVAVVTVDRFIPEWLRIEPGGCVLVVSRSQTDFDESWIALPTKGEAEWCSTEIGVHRLRLGNRPYSGGFVFVDPR